MAILSGVGDLETFTDAGWRITGMPPAEFRDSGGSSEDPNVNRTENAGFMRFQRGMSTPLELN